jgi:hypothetical protein
MCRIKTQEEIDMNPEGNESSFWLLFPPLAIRHVNARDGTVEDNGMFSLAFFPQCDEQVTLGTQH